MVASSLREQKPTCRTYFSLENELSRAVNLSKLKERNSNFFTILLKGNRKSARQISKKITCLVGLIMNGWHGCI